jgi:hypothetical protein
MDSNASHFMQDRDMDDRHQFYASLKEPIESLWEFLEARKYHTAREKCEPLLASIEQDLGDDFGQDTSTLTLYDDPNTLRRKRYLELLQIYQRTLRSLVIELILKTDNLQSINTNLDKYQELRRDIQHAMSKAAYLLGVQYESRIFITSSDLAYMDKLLRKHCQFVLKSEFFKTFKIVIQTLGSLDRKNFHQVTEPYKNLRELCRKCLQMLTVMKDDRFFGPLDTFIEDYERDVNIYLQILWYLGIKSDLNKIDKFLHPNTYSRGLDQQCQVFAAVLLLEEILPHLEGARTVGLSDKAAQDLIEVYAEHWYTVLNHEEELAETEGLWQIQETDRILAEGFSPNYADAFDLSLPDSDEASIELFYHPLDGLKLRYAEKIACEQDLYFQRDDTQAFEDILDKAAVGVGLKEELVESEEEQEPQPPSPKAYRYKHNKRMKGPKFAVFTTFETHRSGHVTRLMHIEWIERIYALWKRAKKLGYMRTIIEQHTIRHEKTKYRVDFAFKFFKGTPFGFRLKDHKVIKVPNPDGRILRPDTTLARTIETLNSSIFSEFLKELRLLYRSRHGLKMQALRWAWFAERELPEGYFDRPKYNYLKYIHTRWKEKVKNHYRALHRLSRRDDGDDD